MAPLSLTPRRNLPLTSRRYRAPMPGPPEDPNPAAPQNLSDPTVLPDTTFNEPGATQPETDPMSTGSSFTEPNDVPGSPLATDPAIVPVTIDPAGPTITSPANPNPIGQNITIGVEAIGGSNASLGNPSWGLSRNDLLPDILVAGF